MIGNQTSGKPVIGSGNSSFVRFSIDDLSGQQRAAVLSETNRAARLLNPEIRRRATAMLNAPCGSSATVDSAAVDA
jgi:hypothetical protein